MMGFLRETTLRTLAGRLTTLTCCNTNGATENYAARHYAALHSVVPEPRAKLERLDALMQRGKAAAHHPPASPTSGSLQPATKRSFQPIRTITLPDPSNTPIRPDQRAQPRDAARRGAI